MRQIRYGESSFGLRFEIPLDWDAQNISEITLTISDLSGQDLLAADAATLWSSSAIQTNGVVSEFDNEVALEVVSIGTVPALKPGDRIEIGPSATGRSEQVEILGWDSGSNTAILKRDLRYDHDDHSPVVGLFAIYILDVSDTDVFRIGKQLLLTWTPDTDNMPFRERAEVAVSALSIPGLEERLMATYPRTHDVLTHPEYRLDAVASEAEFQLSMELSIRGIDLNRVPNYELLVPALMTKMRWLSLLTGDDQYNAEREIANNEHAYQLDLLSKSPIWEDTDQDGIKDELETMYGEQLFGIERNL